MPPIQVRAVITDGHRFGRVLSIQHTGTDIYVCSPVAPGQPDLRQSIHESGKGHVHTPTGRVLHEPRPPLVGRRGVEKVWRAIPGLDLLDWKDKDKADNKNRRTLLVPLEAFTHTYPRVMLDVYLVEHGRPDLADEVLAGIEEHSTVIGHVLAVQTDPHLLVLARGLSPEAAGAVDQMMASAMQGGTTPVPRHWSQVNP